ncbi:hypothetical protein OQH60_03870 [Campylobacter sp. MIT 21-1685]|uniref:hypothetical protein n=1 Tax=unclassified Campylobacter TaxID=2593542 RepID=UPI00224AB763|nr:MULTISPECIES: hypothetical protein [unclassified Campylobacter]MCX2682998.1 hypothetical protein [Campylobacter sp. MIT 21-1684]MCX2751280.1 hypothetical protein [Campylobacter sp. MIT 21-1682]MCX2807479.1 hypothetical protein [Campylobacter sp. MIT 21-1685]
MNLKVFSIIFTVLFIVVLILGGTYYYLFEYSKPNYNYYSNKSKNTTQTQSSQTQNSYTEQSFQNNEFNQTPRELPNEPTENTTDLQFLTQNQTNEYNISQVSPQQDLFQDPQQNINQNSKEQILDQNTSKEKKTARIQTQQKAENNNTNSLQTLNNKRKKGTQVSSQLSPIKEYQQRGKDSRLEPQLSTETVKVYVVDGKALSDYRINLLKEMLEPVQERSIDYNLSVFIEMLPKHEMNLTIYNKDIIFSEKKKAYKYISIEQIVPYLNTPSELNEKVAREEIIERINLQSEEDNKGSNFAQHIKSLKTGLQTAQYFFPFCEVIQITSSKAK